MLAFSWACSSTPNTVSPRARKMPTPTSRGMDTSDLDLDHLLHPEEPAQSQDDGAAEEHLAHAVVEQHAHVARVDEVHGEAQADGQDAEDDGADAALGGERLHVTAQPLAGDHRLRDRPQQLG